MVQLLDRFVESVLAAAKWLALPVVVLLFLQWPLRSIFGVYSREANDLGQWLFALYVAASITAATRAKTHLAADTIARRYSETSRKWLARAGALLGLIPWSIFVIVTGWNIALNSARGLERFPDTKGLGLEFRLEAVEKKGEMIPLRAVAGETIPFTAFEMSLADLKPLPPGDLRFGHGEPTPPPPPRKVGVPFLTGHFQDDPGIFVLQFGPVKPGFVIKAGIKTNWVTAGP